MNQETQIWTKVSGALNEVLQTKDFSAVTMDEIAEKADCTVNTLYRNFGSREQLFLETLRELDDRYREAIEMIRKEKPYAFMTSEERLIEWLSIVIDIYCEGQRAAIDYLNKMEAPEKAHMRPSGIIAFEEICKELLEEMKQDGFLPSDADTEHLYQCVQIAIRGVLIEYLMENRDLSVQRIFRAMIRDVFNGLKNEAPRSWPKHWRDRAAL